MRNIRVCRTPGGFSPDMDQGWQFTSNPLEMFLELNAEDAPKFSYYQNLTSGSYIEPVYKMWRATYTENEWPNFNTTQGHIEFWHASNFHTVQWNENVCGGYAGYRLDDERYFSIRSDVADIYYTDSYAGTVNQWVFVPRLDGTTSNGVWVISGTSAAYALRATSGSTMATPSYWPNLGGVIRPHAINVLTVAQVGKTLTSSTGDYVCFVMCNSGSGQSKQSNSTYGRWSNIAYDWHLPTDTWDLIMMRRYKGTPDAIDKYGTPFGTHLKRLHYALMKRYGVT